MNTAHAPSNRLDPRVKVAWRLQSLLGLLLPFAMAGALGIGASLLGMAEWIPLSIFIVLAIVVVLVVGVAPAVRYRRWRWEVGEHEVRLQEGLIIVSQTVIPMVRVQHVDTAQGPIMRALGLTDVHVWTAAGKHTIPALSDEHAADLRDRIATLARVTDDGGL